MIMRINANTKIAALLKAHPDALETIVSINPKFEKLRNPILRKLMAGRASIAMASKMAGCNVNTFLEKLKPLGFTIEENTNLENFERPEVPPYIKNLVKEQIIELDVRPVIDSGNDPLNIILEKLKQINSGQALKIINSFEPIPLMVLLEKQGFAVYANVINDNLVETFFYKQDEKEPYEIKPTDYSTEGWDEICQQFRDRFQYIDVRDLEMPLPMLRILDTLEELPLDKALFVFHKRVPLFLLPELKDRKFAFCIKEISDNEVNLIIYRAQNVR